MNKREIVRQVLKRLNEKKLLRESPEGESNAFTSDIQTCVQEISSAQEYVEQLYSSTVDTDDQDLLNLIKEKLNYVSNTLNDIVGKSTAEDSTIEEADNPEVKMSIDKVVEHPDDVKKLQDKKIDVNVTDDQGNSLVEKKKYSKKK
jgi:hypothetical protein